MAIHHIIAALVDDWDRVNGLLDDQARAELRRRVAAMATAVSTRQRRTRASRVVQLLLTSLAEDDPVLAIDIDAIRRTALFADADKALFLLASELHIYGGRRRTAAERILASHWETAHALRCRGVDPDVPGLIRLDHPDGGFAVPAFQFDAWGLPLAVVLRVNHVLGADADPWGAADWWLSANVWLRDPPSALLGRCPDDLLLAAATAVVEG